jgi:translation initiation factor 1
MRIEDEDEDVVYSTEFGDMRKSGGKGAGGKGKKKQRAGARPPAEGIDGTAKVRREKKGRGGKTVTAVYGLDLDPDSLRDLGKKIKQSCGCGGSAKNGVIEIQGDKVDEVIDILEKEGHAAKKAGG